MMDIFLHTEFQHVLEQAHLLADERTSQSCAKAKALLLKALQNPLLQLDDTDNVIVDLWSDDIKCARALLHFALG